MLEDNIEVYEITNSKYISYYNDSYVYTFSGYDQNNNKEWIKSKTNLNKIIVCLKNEENLVEAQNGQIIEIQGSISNPEIHQNFYNGIINGLISKEESKIERIDDKNISISFGNNKLEVEYEDILTETDISLMIILCIGVC